MVERLRSFSSNVLTHQKVFALFVLLAALPVLAQEAQEDSGDGGLQPCEPEEVPPPLPLAISAPSILFLIVMSGLFSGLTLGLMGLDVIALQIVQKGDDKVLARCAEQIAPVREKGNQLLCTLLLGNVAVNSALSILSADIFSGTVGFVVSTATIVIFGEIIPQAACSRYALQVGARTVPLVKVLMLVFFVLAKPISICLDWMLGQEMGTVHSRTELMEMLKLQISLGAVDAEEGAMAQQVAEGALSFRDKKVSEIMTPLEDAYMLSTETKLGYATIREVFETGFSRIPVYGTNKHDYRGLLYTKDLMLADPEDEMKLGDFIHIFNRKVETLFPENKLVSALNTFKKGGTHMALVRQAKVEVDTDPRFEVVGVITLEDIVEEILQEEIVDETDVYVDVDRGVRVKDGRENRIINLGVFNPIWQSKGDRLGSEEVRALSSHLHRTFFSQDNDLQLSYQAVEWLVSVAEVISLTRVSPVWMSHPDDPDWLYRRGQISDRCTLVLQGRVGVISGVDNFRSDVGSFSLLGRDALRIPDFEPDFGAFLSTPKVRVLSFTTQQFQAAKELDENQDSLQQAKALQESSKTAAASRRLAKHVSLHLGIDGTSDVVRVATEDHANRQRTYSDEKKSGLTTAREAYRMSL